MHHVQHVDRHTVNDDRLFYSVKESSHPRARGGGDSANVDDSSDKFEKTKRTGRANPTADKRRASLTASRTANLHSMRLNNQNCEVLVRINRPSPEIGGGVHHGKDDFDEDDGNRSIMFKVSG